MPHKPLNYTPWQVKACAICGALFIQAKNFKKYCCKACAKIAKDGQRGHIGPDRVTTSPRTCLRCGSRFPSTGPENRICKACSQENHKLFNTYTEEALVGGIFLLRKRRSHASKS
jgi:hypothetical protein